MPIFDEKIKLVIWDLDETFWEGTLSEGGEWQSRPTLPVCASLSTAAS